MSVTQPLSFLAPVTNGYSTAAAPVTNSYSTASAAAPVTNSYSTAAGPVTNSYSTVSAPVTNSYSTATAVDSYGSPIVQRDLTEQLKNTPVLRENQVSSIIQATLLCETNPYFGKNHTIAPKDKRPFLIMINLPRDRIDPVPISTLTPKVVAALSKRPSKESMPERGSLQVK